MVSEALQKQLMPFVNLEYGGLGEVSLDETTLYVEHYEAYHEVQHCTVDDGRGRAWCKQHAVHLCG